MTQARHLRVITASCRTESTTILPLFVFFKKASFKLYTVGPGDKLPSFGVSTYTTKKRRMEEAVSTYVKEIKPLAMSVEQTRFRCAPLSALRHGLHHLMRRSGSRSRWAGSRAPGGRIARHPLPLPAPSECQIPALSLVEFDHVLTRREGDYSNSNIQQAISEKSAEGRLRAFRKSELPNSIRRGTIIL